MALTRRELLWAPLAAPRVVAQSRRKLNVPMIAVDDLNTRIGCYGDPVAKTPNIDRLAERGVRFDRAYCNYPLCNPSRTSLLSGRRPETTRIFDNNTPPRTYLGDILFMPEYFKAHGYFTARVGKVAHGLFEHQIKWDISESRAGIPISQERRVTDEDTQLAAKRQEKRKAAGQEAGALVWRKTDREDADEPDGATARRIVEILKQHKDGPFFIACGFHKPHLPWVAPRKYFDMYSLDQIKLPNTPPDDRDDIPPIALTFREGEDQMTDLQRREAILAYHAATSFMDAQVGVVLDAVDQLKLWDNTVVFLFGDHGFHLFDHLQLWRKMTLFEQAARAPLIFHAPGMAKAWAACGWWSSWTCSPP
jgi:iduronate 2-sulfatase